MSRIGFSPGVGNSNAGAVFLVDLMFFEESGGRATSGGLGGY
eukprot:SAG22_NODE_1233_length_5065_cov_12.050141_5_plen_42_part_00